MSNPTETRSKSSKPPSGGSILRARIKKPIGVGSKLCERYLLEDVLRQNDLGTVYRARDCVLSDDDQGRTHYVAVQLLPPALADDDLFLERCKQAFAQMRSWSHENLVQAYSFERHGSQYFLTLEHVEGESLRWILDELRPEVPDREEIRPIIAAVASALSYLGARDTALLRVTADDVLVTHDSRIKLTSIATINFGGAELASVAYNRGDDVYTLACLVYELHTGQRPFVQATRRTRDGRVEPERIPGMPRGEWRALREALMRRGDRPHPTMQAFLSAFIGAEPVVSADQPRRAPPRAGTGVRRAVWATSAVVVFIAAAAAATLEPVRNALEPAVAWVTTIAGNTRDRLLPADAPESVVGPERSVATREHDLPPSGEPVAADGASPPGDTFSSEQSGAGDTIATESDRLAAPGDDSAPERIDEVSPVTEPAPLEPVEAPAATAAEAPDALEDDAIADDALADEALADESPADGPPADDPLPVPVPESVSPGRFSFATDAVTVRESQGHVRLTIERRGGSAGAASVVWWTSDGTAVADEDYIDLGVRVESLEDGERERTIFIPLVVDSIPGDQKYFHVHLGEGSDAPLGSITSVNITVIDDS